MGLYADQLAADQGAGTYPSKINPQLPQRRMSASPPQRAGRYRAGSYSRSRSRSPAGDGGSDNTTVFVGNLAHDMTDRTLREFFGTWGNVVETKIIIDQETGRSRGFGFIKFDDARDADDAIAQADGKLLSGRNLKCNMARYPRGGPAFRGGGSGNFRGAPRGSFRGRDSRGGGRFGGPPGRRSVSPGRYSPGRYSPARSDSGYSSRSHSGPGSPPAKRRRPRSPMRAPPRVGRRRARRSKSGSYSSRSRSSGSSYSTTDSELSHSPPRKKGAAPGGAAAPPPAGTVPPPGQFKKELAQAKRRESELAARLAQLEGEVHTARSATQTQQAQASEMGDRLAASEKACKKYREWLSGMLECATAVVKARQHLTAAEQTLKESHDDLALYSKEAEELLTSTAKSHGSRRRRRNKEPGPEGEGVDVTVNGAVVHVAPADAEAALAAQAARDAAKAARSAAAAPEGGWGEDMDVGEGEDAAAKFKPGIKFKLQS